MLLDAVILSDYAKGLLSDELVARVSALAREHKKFLAIDPKPRRKLKFFQPDLLTPNRKESLQLAGLDPEPHQPFPAAEVCARIYEQYQPKYLVITLSEDGMAAFPRCPQGRSGHSDCGTRGVRCFPAPAITLDRRPDAGPWLVARCWRKPPNSPTPPRAWSSARSARPR